ncbi:MAG: hypothetical protein ACRDI2_22090, partial [Chloroflexota bacterium]
MVGERDTAAGGREAPVRNGLAYRLRRLQELWRRQQPEGPANRAADGGLDATRPLSAVDGVDGVNGSGADQTGGPMGPDPG